MFRTKHFSGYNLLHELTTPYEFYIGLRKQFMIGGLVVPWYMGFFSEHIETIVEVLSFVKSMVKKYWTEKKLAVGEAHRDVVDKRIGKEIEMIEQVETFFTKKAGSMYHMRAKTHETLMDTVRSALEIYLRDTLEAKAKTGLSEFDAKIEEIRRLTRLEGLKNRKTDIYDKYYKALISSPEGGKFEVFLSYSHDDRVLAGEIAELLTGRGINVFLAHEDIEISEEWREEIFKHLESCSVLLALLTPNFEKSIWANQEVGYMQGKKGRVIPLIVRKADIKKFGFLEALQGITVKDGNLDNCAMEILRTILR